MSINYGVQAQNYPVYPNCFDQLTTHGIVAEDVVGYITGTPSPYLQNYVAQRGWAPSLPGQITPDPLPPVIPPQTVQNTNVNQTIPPQTVQNNDIYQTVPKQEDINTYVKKDKKDTWKKVAAAILLTGVSAFLAVKGVQLFKNRNAVMQSISNKFGSWGSAIKSSLSSAGTKISDFCKNAWAKTRTFASTAWTATSTFLKNAWNKTCTFIKNTWNKIFNKTSNP